MENQNQNQSGPTLAQIGNEVSEAMFAGARVQKDKGRIEYKAEIHRSLAAYAMAKVMEKYGLPPSASKLRALLAMVDNHSAWRQKFEKEEIFPKKKERSVEQMTDGYLSELESEGV